MRFPPVTIRPHVIPVLFLALWFALSLRFPSRSSEPASENSALVLTVDGPINPAVSDYIKNGFMRAATDEADLIIIRMNTPGGLDASMRDIIQEILSSPIPVATYVWPDGARAASAGTYILYGSHIAAMAPATNLGAATPVQIGGMGGKKDEEKPDSEDSKPAGSALLIIMLVSRTVAMRNKRVHTGLEAMIGTIGEARVDFNGTGLIWINGESWNAQSSVPVKKGDTVRILSISGLELIVEPLEKEP